MKCNALSPRGSVTTQFVFSNADREEPSPGIISLLLFVSCIIHRRSILHSLYDDLHFESNEVEFCNITCYRQEATIQTTGAWVDIRFISNRQHMSEDCVSAPFNLLDKNEQYCHRRQLKGSTMRKNSSQLKIAHCTRNGICLNRKQNYLDRKRK